MKALGLMNRAYINTIINHTNHGRKPSAITHLGSTSLPTCLTLHKTVLLSSFPATLVCSSQLAAAEKLLAKRGVAVFSSRLCLASNCRNGFSLGGIVGK